MNTANCYVVNAPGTYTLPLVYGNGQSRTGGIHSAGLYLGCQRETIS